MNQRKETAEILAWLADLRAAGKRAALATVVGIEGSAYRRPGAKLLIAEDGASLGCVSGGCLEADVREIAQSVLATGQPRLRRYDTGSSHDEIVWGLGLGCNGTVDVFVQPASEGPFATLAAALSQLVAGDSPFALATVVEDLPGGRDLGSVLLVADLRSPGSNGSNGTLGSPALDRQIAEQARAVIARGRSEVRPLGDRRVFIEQMPAPDHLIVCGAGDDAQPLVATAGAAGLRVTVVDHRPALLGHARFPPATRLLPARPEDPGIVLPPAARSLAVVMTHSLVHDTEWARRLLAAGTPFVGLLGPRARGEAIRREIGAAGSEFDERVFGPVGLDLGAEGPHEIAISIVAQLLAFRAGRRPRPLVERREAIHAI
jgi:xanthine dehydrogenase accessory factor